MSKEVCHECKLAFADYDRKVQVMVEGKLCLFHPACLDRERQSRMRQKPQQDVSGTRMSKNRGRS